jgi:uncharacterized protein
MTKVRSENAELHPGAAADAHPIAPSDRILAIDIVRGIALLGVMAINVITDFRVSIFDTFVSRSSSNSCTTGSMAACLTMRCTRS